jgi:hypothetical protein
MPGVMIVFFRLEEILFSFISSGDIQIGEFPEGFIHVLVIWSSVLFGLIFSTKKVRETISHEYSVGEKSGGYFSLFSPMPYLLSLSSGLEDTYGGISDTCRLAAAFLLFSGD